MSTQVVAYKNDQHVDTDSVNDLPLALVWINERKDYIDAFSIFPDLGEGDTIMGEIKDEKIVLRVMQEA